MVTAELPLNFRLGVALVALQLLSILLISHSMPADIPAYSNSPTSSTLVNSQPATDDAVVEIGSVREFIGSGLDSTVIDEFEQSSTYLGSLLLKNKLADTIINIEEMEKAAAGGQISPESSDRDWFIAIIHTERKPCKRPEVKRAKRVKRVK